jgi:hypothetical protein
MTMTIETQSMLVISESATQTDTSTSANATVGVATSSSDAQPPDNAALIGGIVGGVVALILVVGVVTFLVARSRRRGNGEPNSNAALQSVRHNSDSGAGAAPRGSNYAPLALSPPNNYGVAAPHQSQNYDAWSTREDIYGKPSRNGTDYEDFSKVN